jgi:hypothetical protein
MRPTQFSMAVTMTESLQLEEYIVSRKILILLLASLFLAGPTFAPVTSSAVAGWFTKSSKSKTTETASKSTTSKSTEWKVKRGRYKATFKVESRESTTTK